LEEGRACLAYAPGWTAAPAMGDSGQRYREAGVPGGGLAGGREELFFKGHWTQEVYERAAEDVNRGGPLVEGTFICVCRAVQCEKKTQKWSESIEQPQKNYYWRVPKTSYARKKPTVHFVLGTKASKRMAYNLQMLRLMIRAEVPFSEIVLENIPTFTRFFFNKADAISLSSSLLLFSSLFFAFCSSFHRSSSPPHSVLALMRFHSLVFIVSSFRFSWFFLFLSQVTSFSCLLVPSFCQSLVSSVDPSFSRPVLLSFRQLFSCSIIFDIASFHCSLTPSLPH
jgi:hypothetical protein